MFSRINLKLNDEVYYPSKTNDILSVVHVHDTDDYPIRLNKYPTTFLHNGLEFILDENPSIFPATVEWYNILKGVYPDLKPPTIRVKVLLTREITEYYEIEIEESNPRVASDIAKEMLKDSTDGFKLVSTNSCISLRQWEKK